MHISSTKNRETIGKKGVLMFTFLFYYEFNVELLDENPDQGHIYFERFVQCQWHVHKKVT